MADRHYLVGTAGHVDHGKTELIRALSGIETDRLREEKQRGISIELGFAHMTLPSGRQVGIVDVPGHEKFIRQMLAGASGMDLFLLVIAADEGIMPQTQEHLEILTMLGIERGIVVLNKIDLVDNEWVDLMEEEIREKLQNTVFQEAPFYRVSAMKGIGLEELRTGIDLMLTEAEARKSSGPVRMPIDRVFTIQGFGTVVTGTLHSGMVQIGQDLAMEPGHMTAKVRSLQVYNQKVDSAAAGQRVAVNLAGLEVSEVKRGTVLVSDEAFKVGNILDVSLLNLASAEKSIAQRQRIRFHLGTSEILGRVHLLEHEELAPGETGFAQILLEEEVLAAYGDRFVLRFYSPTHTIGGGKILGVADYKQKRFKDSVLAQMRIKEKGDPLEILARELSRPVSAAELVTRLQTGREEIENRLALLAERQRLEIFMEDEVVLYWGSEQADEWRSKLLDILQAFEEKNPLRLGMSREELKTRLGIEWTSRRWQTILEQGAIKNYYRLNGNKVQTNEDRKMPKEIAEKLENLKKKWQGVKLAPPDLNTAAEGINVSKNEAVEYAQYLCDIGEWIHIDQQYYARQDLEEAKIELIDYLKSHGEIGVAEVREIWKTTRKYAVPLLEYFDYLKITRRMGDKRILF